jgi:hypothetical protein
VPFTVSHVAAALPMRRSRLVLSAVVVGTMAPDFEYFVRLSPGGGWGHTIAGAFCLSLPLGLVVLWLFHRYARLPMVALLPQGLECRLGPYLQPFRFRGRFLLILVSLLAGIATHLAWDSFTHPHTWLYHHWDFLHRRIHLPRIGFIHNYFLLQLISSVGGILVLLVWFGRWYRATPLGPQPLSRTFTPSQKVIIAAAMLTLSSAGGILRATLLFGIPRSRGHITDFAGDMIVTTGALLWWQLVAWGVLLRSRIASLTTPSQPVAR